MSAVRGSRNFRANGAASAMLLPSGGQSKTVNLAGVSKRSTIEVNLNQKRSVRVKPAYAQINDYLSVDKQTSTLPVNYMSSGNISQN